MGVLTFSPQRDGQHPAQGEGDLQNSNLGNCFLPVLHSIENKDVVLSVFNLFFFFLPFFGVGVCVSSLSSRPGNRVGEILREQSEFWVTI